MAVQRGAFPRARPEPATRRSSMEAAMHRSPACPQWTPAAGRRSTVRAITILLLPCLFALAIGASNASAQSNPPGDEAQTSSEDTGEAGPSYRSHPILIDIAYVGAAFGLVGGYVEGRCRDEGYDYGLPVGHALMGALIGAMAFLGNENGDYGDLFHPPDPVSDLDRFRGRSRNGARVEVRLQDGSVMVGKVIRVRSRKVLEKVTELQAGRVEVSDFVEVRRHDLIVKVNGEQEVVPDSAICAIATRRDSPWDGFAYGAFFGAIYGYLYADLTPKAEGVSVSSTGMAALGAAVVGTAGFFADSYHNGRNVLLNRTWCPTVTASASPYIVPGGGGVAVSLRF